MMQRSVTIEKAHRSVSADRVIIPARSRDQFFDGIDPCPYLNSGPKQASLDVRFESPSSVLLFSDNTARARVIPLGPKQASLAVRFESPSSVLLSPDNTSRARAILQGHISDLCSQAEGIRCRPGALSVISCFWT